MTTSENLAIVWARLHMHVQVKGKYQVDVGWDVELEKEKKKKKRDVREGFGATPEKLPSIDPLSAVGKEDKNGIGVTRGCA